MKAVSAERAEGPGLETRLIAGGAALLASSVLADSATEHYRGSFANPAMVLPIAASLLSLGVNGRRAVLPHARVGTVSRTGHAAAALIGAAGFAFHAYNVGKQPGGYRLVNLFYRAPLGAPGALVLAGLLGALAGRRRRTGCLTGSLSALGLAGTVAEVGLLHYRGAYHNPFMWLPVVLPPVAAASTGFDVAVGKAHRGSFALLGLTAALGFVGVAFHAYGVSRNSGGWTNWRQNLLAGPPVPAPPSFTGIALAGIGALLAMRRTRHA